MIPYKKISVKTATHIVVRIKSFDDLMCRRYGGGEVESRRAPEMKFFSLPMIYYKRSVGYQAEFRGLTPASVMYMNVCTIRSSYIFRRISYVF
jgi:hypothetical protein